MGKNKFTHVFIVFIFMKKLGSLRLNSNEEWEIEIQANDTFINVIGRRIHPYKLLVNIIVH